MLEHIIQVEFGSTSQYFSTTLGTPPNLKPFAQSFDTSTLFPTIIIIADPLPSMDSKRFSSSALLINYWGVVFSLIPVEDSISQQSSSIFPSPK